MNKKIVPIIFIIIGAACLLGAGLFFVDSLTATEPVGLGKWIFDIFGLIFGAGAGIKGLMDLFKKNEAAPPSSRIVGMDDSQIATGENGRNIKQGENSKYFERVENYHEAPTIKPDLHPSLGSIPPFSADTYVHRGHIEDDIRTALRKGGASAIVGLHAPGGTGKTELAARIAQEVKDGKLGFENVLWMDVNEKTPQETLSEALRKSGIQVQPNASETDKRAEWHYFLAQHKLLVIFDDVRASSAQGLKELLPPPPCAALITSRIQQMAGVREFALDHMEPAQARELFVNSLGEDVVKAEEEMVLKLAERCKYNPLALEIASRRIRQSQNFNAPITKYYEKAEKRFEELKMHGDARWNMTGVFDLSYNDLAEADQKYFRALSVFAPTGFSPNAAAHIWELSADGVGEVLSRFINLSLVIPVKGDVERYRLHDLLDEYADLKLANDKNLIIKLLSEWVLDLFKNHSTDITPESIPLIISEFDNLRKVVYQGIESADGNFIANLIYWSDNWLKVFNLHTELILWAKKSIELGISNKEMEANVLQAIGDVQQFRKETDAAIESYNEALKLFRQVGAKLGEANTLAAMTRLSLQSGDIATAETQLEKVILMRREIGDLYSEGADYGNFAFSLQNLGNKEKAKEYALKARLIFVKINLPAIVEMMDKVISAEDN